jgi:hypothetical protein
MTKKTASPTNSTDEDGHSWPELVRSRLRSDGVEFAVNSELVPIARITDDGFRTEWEINSERFMDYLIATCMFDSELNVWTSNDMSVVTALLREDCRRGGRSVTEVEVRKIESDPIVQTLLSYMEGQDEFFHLTGTLLMKLKEIEGQHSFFSSKSITGFVSAFGCQLRRLIPVLRAYGIEVTFVHREDGSHVRLRRLATFAPLGVVHHEADAADGMIDASSEEPSVVTAVLGRSLVPTDGTDGKTRVDADPVLAEQDGTEGGAA